MAEQLILDLPVRTALERDDFFVSPANAGAVAGIDNWHNWPHSKMVLVGPEASGKTHLAHVWAAMSGAQVLTVSEATKIDPETAPAALAIDGLGQSLTADQETALFHLHNAIVGQGGRLLLTASTPPTRWPLALPDLASRVQQAGVLVLDPPDEALLSAIIVKLAADRQLSLSPDLISYSVLRMERSFAAARRLVEAIDARSLRDKARPTKPMIAGLLAEWDG